MVLMTSATAMTLEPETSTQWIVEGVGVKNVHSEGPEQTLVGTAVRGRALTGPGKASLLLEWGDVSILNTERDKVEGAGQTGE